MTERTIRLSRDAIVEAVQWWFDTKVRPTTPLTATSFSVGENGTFLFLFKENPDGAITGQAGDHPA
jgi:hypothetical protein